MKGSLKLPCLFQLQVRLHICLVAQIRGRLQNFRRMHSAVLLCVLSSLRFCASALLGSLAEPEPELLLSTPAWNVSGTTDTASVQVQGPFGL